MPSPMNNKSSLYFAIVSIILGSGSQGALVKIVGFSPSGVLLSCACAIDPVMLDIVTGASNNNINTVKILI
jgi:hypothetical protein